MRLLLSEHAKKRMFQRGIPVEEVKEIISKGRKWREGSTIHPAMRGIEVVYRMVGLDAFVITVYYE